MTSYCDFRRAGNMMCRIHHRKHSLYIFAIYKISQQYIKLSTIISTNYQLFLSLPLPLPPLSLYLSLRKKEYTDHRIVKAARNIKKNSTPVWSLQLCGLCSPSCHLCLSSLSYASPLVLRASSLGSTIPSGGTLFHSHPDVKWVAVGSMGAQGVSAVGCGVAPWESSAVFSTGVAWVDEDQGRTGSGGMDDSLSPPHPPPCTTPHGRQRQALSRR